MAFGGDSSPKPSFGAGGAWCPPTLSPVLNNHIWSSAAAPRAAARLFMFVMSRHSSGVFDLSGNESLGGGSWRGSMMESNVSSGRVFGDLSCTVSQLLTTVLNLHEPVGFGVLAAFCQIPEHV